MPKSSEVRLGAFRMRINWVVFACVAITAFTFVRLGFWQLDRAGEKLQIQTEFEAQQQRNATGIQNISLDDLTNDPENYRNFHVAMNGEYQNERNILVLAQFFESQIGYEVITPFQLQGSDLLVLVSRGWTSGILPPNTPPNLQPVAGPQQLTAQLVIPTADERILSSQIDASEWPIRVRSVEVDVLQALFDEPLFPYLVRLTEGQPGMLVRHWREANADINNNLSYALQWFTFAILLVIGSILASSNLLKLMKDPEEDKFK